MIPMLNLGPLEYLAVMGGFLVLLWLVAFAMRIQWHREEVSSNIRYGQRGGVDYSLEGPGRNRSTLIEWSVRIKINSSMAFTLQQWGTMQGSSQRASHARKFFTHDPAFDARVFVASGGSEFRNILLKDSELRELIMHLYRMGITMVGARGGYLEAGSNISGTRWEHIYANEPALNTIVDDLIKIRKLLQVEPVPSILKNQNTQNSNTPNTSSPKSQSMERLANLSLGIFYVITLAGGASAGLTDYYNPYALVEPWSQRFLILVGATAGLAVLIGVAVIMLVFREKAQANRMLRHFLLLGGIGLLCFSYAGIKTANMVYDDSPATARMTTVLGKSGSGIMPGEMGGEVRVASWQNQGGTLYVHVSKNDYGAIKRKQKLKVNTRPGALRLEWIEGYELVKK